MTDLEKIGKKVDELKEDVSEIKTALKGYNGNTGLIPAFTEHCEHDALFRKDYYQFKRNVLIIFAFVLGTGTLGVGIWQILARI